MKRIFLILFLLIAVNASAGQTPFNGGSVLWPRIPDNINTTPTYTAVVLDGADEAQAVIFQAPKTGNISNVCFATGTVTTGETMDVRLESVDTATGDPSGSLFGTNTNGALVINNADDNTFLCKTLTSAAAVTQGNYIALVLKNPNTSFGNLQIRTFADDGISQFPYNANFITGSWAKATTGSLVAIGYDDGTYPYIASNHPIESALTVRTYNSGTAGADIYGVRFQVPFNVTVNGAWMWADTDGDADLLLVDSTYNEGAGTGILATATVDPNIDSAATAGLMVYRFNTSVVLSSDTWYRLILRPTTVSNVTLYQFDVLNTSIMQATPGGQNFQMTTAKTPTGDGDWTNSSTDQIWMGIILNSFDKLGGTGVGFISN